MFPVLDLALPMATSKYDTTQCTSSEFVESSGAILFDLTHEPRRVCLIHYAAKNEWLLAKGRRNCGESRRDAALREVEEETGYKCHIYPVTMPVRAPRIDEADDVIDRARTYPDLSEPFMVTIRELQEKSDVNIIGGILPRLMEMLMPTQQGSMVILRLNFSHIMKPCRS